MRPAWQGRRMDGVPGVPRSPPPKRGTRQARLGDRVAPIVWRCEFSQHGVLRGTLGLENGRHGIAFDAWRHRFASTILKKTLRGLYFVVFRRLTQSTGLGVLNNRRARRSVKTYTSARVCPCSAERAA